MEKYFFDFNNEDISQVLFYQKKRESDKARYHKTPKLVRYVFLSK